MAEVLKIEGPSDEMSDTSGEASVFYVKPRLSMGQFALRSVIFTTALGASLALGAKFGIQWGTADTRDDLAVTQARLEDAQAEANQLEGTVADLITAAETANLEDIGRQAEVAMDALDRARGVFRCVELQTAGLPGPVAVDHWCRGNS